MNTDVPDVSYWFGLDRISIEVLYMMIFLNGEHNMIIIPKETLEKLGKPKYFQVSSDGKGIVIRYSNRKLAEASVIDYPLKNNAYGLHIRDEKKADSLRKRYKWGNYIYAVDAMQFLNALIIDPGKAEKTEIPNKGL